MAHVRIFITIIKKAVGIASLIATRLEEQLMLAAHLKTAGQIVGGQIQVVSERQRCCRHSTWKSIRTCILFYYISLWDLFQLNGCQCSLYYCLLEPTAASANQPCLTLSSVCFEVVLAEGRTSDCRKSLFFSKPFLGFRFSNTGKRSEKRRGGKPPKPFSRTALLAPSGQATCEDQIISEMQWLLNTCQQNLQSAGRSMLMYLG